MMNMIIVVGGSMVAFALGFIGGVFTRIRLVKRYKFRELARRTEFKILIQACREALNEKQFRRVVNRAMKLAEETFAKMEVK